MTIEELIKEAKERYELARLAGLHVNDAGNDPDIGTFRAMSACASLVPDLIKKIEELSPPEPILGPAFGISRLVKAGIVPHYAQKVIVEFGTDEFVTVHAKYAIDNEKLGVVEVMAKEAIVLRGDDYLLAVKERESEESQ